MKNILISNLDSTIDAIQAVGKIVTGAKFIIDESGLSCYVKISMARIQIRCKCVTCDESIQFCINDFGKFLNYLKLISKSENTDNGVVLVFNKTHIKYKGSLVEFKYMLCREEIVSQFNDSLITTETIPEYQVETSYDAIRSILSNKNLISEDLQSITYKLESDPIKTKMMFAHLEDIQNPSSNTIKLYLGNITMGEVSQPIYLNTERIQLATILKCENITLTKSMNKNHMIIDLEDIGEDDEIISTIKIYTSLVKGYA